MVISIFKFLSRYYGIILDATLECSHMDLRKNFKFIKTCSLRYASNNIELVNTGKIIYVEDTFGSIKAYVCPSKVLFSNKECICDKECEENEVDYSLNQIKKMPTYLVRELLSKYKNIPSKYRILKMELMSRGVYQNKRHKILKEVEKLKESGTDDKYKRRRKIKCKKS